MNLPASYRPQLQRHAAEGRLLAKAIGLADAGAPFGVLGPGPHWHPRRRPEMPDVAPPAAQAAGIEALTES